MLYQIPKSNDWVDLEQIVSVSSTFVGDQSYGHVNVIITLKIGHSLYVKCEKGGYIEANQVRDEIAEATNKS